MCKWIIASNRLPFTYDQAANELRPSSGGLVTAISGIQSDIEKIWVGVTPDGEDAKAWRKLYDQRETKRQYHPIIVDSESYDGYYNGMCNNVLWPILHYESELVDFNEKLWRSYVAVNTRFAEEIASIAEADDMVWVHDFHLFLLPQELKKLRPDLRVGFFLHTPFPSSEVFRQLPVRDRVLESVLCSDLVGFHDYSYLRHFTSSVHYILGHDYEKFSIRHADHRTHLGVFPVSIDTQHFENISASTEVKQLVQQFRKDQSYEQVILGVDRLDYIKGIELKLKAFSELLERFPEFRGKVGLVQIAVPSRLEVPGFQQLRSEIEQLVGQINGRFGKPNYVPVQYLFCSLPFNELLALYRSSNVLFVSSKRDGMNLVALEYLAAQRAADPGVVVLSEFTGATSTLSHVIHTNPWDREGTARNLKDALNMDLCERRYRHGLMIKYLESYTATQWADSFMISLKGTAQAGVVDKAHTLQPNASDDLGLEDVMKRVSKQPLVVFVDYDGTLVPICDHPSEAKLDADRREALQAILKGNGLELVVVSGRDQKFLAEQLSGLNVSMACEHGSRFYDRKLKKWKTLVRNNKSAWFSLVSRLMEDYSRRVPGSFVEKKRFGICWHYRRSPAAFGSYQARKLFYDLESALHSLPVQVLRGKKVVEVRAIEANKGTFANWYSDSFCGEKQAQLFAIGDDQTDEDLFSYLAEHGGISVKIGEGATCAQYRLPKQDGVFQFLECLKARAERQN